MLTVEELLVLHRHSLVHVRRARHRRRQSGTARNLMRRVVRKLWHLSTLTLEGRRHTTTTWGLGISELL
jgi:hypothetical protein